jgi:hypothetical protein
LDAFRFPLGWLGKILSRDGAQNSDWVVAAWILVLLALCFTRQCGEKEDSRGTEEIDPANEFGKSLVGSSKDQ